MGQPGPRGLPPAPAGPRYTLWAFTKGCKRWCDVMTGLFADEAEDELQVRLARLRTTTHQTRLIVLPDGEDPHRRWPQG